MGTMITAGTPPPSNRSKVRSSPLLKRRSRDSTRNRRLWHSSLRFNIWGFVGILATGFLFNSLLPMIDWNAVDTVLLDMDGTLLDLHFDNYFWLTHLPKR